MTHPRKSRNESREQALSKKGMAPRLVATQLLTRVVDDARNLDALCDRNHGLKEYLSLADKDRNLARAITMTALRQRNQIEAVLRKLYDRPPPKRARFLNHSLHIAIAQVLYMSVPERAAIDLAVSAIGNDKRTSRFRGFANAILRKLAREKVTFTEPQPDISPFPKWLEKAIRRDFGKEKLSRISASLVHAPSLDLSVKSDPEKWAKILDGTVLPSGSVRLTHNKPVIELEGYGDGEWWVQDVAASLPARLISAPSGAEVLELCAAPGGKTAQLINAGFDVTALDISRPRLNRLQENLSRLKFEAELVEADILEWEAPTKYDAILLDAPCSSTGTIRRHPDVIWTKSVEEISALAKLQKELLVKASDFVKPGGEIVFSNCSLLKEEGEDMLAEFLKLDLGLELVPLKPEEVHGFSNLINGQGVLRSLPFNLEVDRSPEMSGMDGFFACKFLKR